MPGLIAGLELARRALLAHQGTLSVTGHNVANVATPGFTRRKALLEPSNPEQAEGGRIGTGVDFVGVQRRRDLFLDAQIRAEMGGSGRWGARAESLGRVEALLNEPSGSGLAENLTAFWNAWLDLSNQPEDFAARSVVVQRGQTMVEAFQQLDTRLESVLDASDEELRQAVVEVNARLDEIGRLNEQIHAVGSSHGETADLEDRRDLLLDTLAQEIGASHLVRADGTVVVRVGHRTVVQGNDVQELAVERFAQGDAAHLRVVFRNDGSLADGLAGRIGGLVEVREQTLPGFRKDLGDLLVSVARSVNQVHAAGSSGLPFFRGSRLDDLEVVPKLRNDPSLVSAGSSGDAGDNDIALAVAALRDARNLGNGTATPGGFLSSLVAGIGSLTQQARIVSEGQENAVQALEAERQSKTGVNLDEEMSRIVESQRAYQAAARLFTTFDELYQTLLNM